MNASTIKDSGTRREFDSGAVRDIQEGKGRCDLLPLDVIAEFYKGDILRKIYQFTKTGEVCWLYEVVAHIAPTFGGYNWQKGIPTHCYVDSAIRHLMKWSKGDQDEPHLNAFVWNILCCIWTCQHKPELNDYAKDGGSDAQN